MNGADQPKGYHNRIITPGVFGEISKIREEFEELMDAHAQGNKIMELIELSDLIGAIEGYIKKEFKMELADVIIMKNATKRAFQDKTRIPKETKVSNDKIVASVVIPPLPRDELQIINGDDKRYLKAGEYSLQRITEDNRLVWWIETEEATKLTMKGSIYAVFKPEVLTSEGLVKVTKNGFPPSEVFDVVYGNNKRCLKKGEYWDGHPGGHRPSWNIQGSNSNTPTKLGLRYAVFKTHTEYKDPDILENAIAGGTNVLKPKKTLYPALPYDNLELMFGDGKRVLSTEDWWLLEEEWSPPRWIKNSVINGIMAEGRVYAVRKHQ